METRALYFVWGASCIACLALGIGIGFLIWGRHRTGDGPAPAQRQADASLVLERKPADNIAPAPHELPANATEKRRIALTVKPKNCAETHLNLSVVDDGKGERYVASSPDGEVTAGLDQPIVRAFEPSAPRLWATGVSWAGRRAPGVFLQRDIWRLRFGIEVNAGREGGAEARASVGWSW